MLKSMNTWEEQMLECYNFKQSSECIICIFQASLFQKFKSQNRENVENRIPKMDEIYTGLWIAYLDIVIGSGGGE